MLIDQKGKYEINNINILINFKNSKEKPVMLNKIPYPIIINVN
jgi:hypothetical protein